MRFALIIAVLCSLAGVAHATPAGEPHKAYLTLIIDDLGQNLPRDRRVLALPGPVTTAIMPDTPHAAEFAREAHKARFGGTSRDGAARTLISACACAPAWRVAVRQ